MIDIYFVETLQCPETLEDLTRLVELNPELTDQLIRDLFYPCESIEDLIVDEADLLH